MPNCPPRRWYTFILPSMVCLPTVVPTLVPIFIIILRGQKGSHFNLHFFVSKREHFFTYPYWLSAFLLWITHSGSLTIFFSLTFSLCFLSSIYWFLGTLYLLWILLWISLFIMVYRFISYGFFICCKCASPRCPCILKLYGIFSIYLLTCVSLKVMLLIDIELAYMNTNHEDFIGFAKWVLLGQRR